MYYPYPDYKFMHTLFSKDRLPENGELKDNIRNFDRDRLLLFDEKLAFENILRENEFPLFSNSYMPVHPVLVSLLKNMRNSSSQS